MSTADIHECENKMLRSKKDIEQEFKNLKFIHCHEPVSNDATIYDHVFLNGSFKNNCVITTTDDLHIAFEHELFIPHTLGEFWDYYNSHKQSHNIFIDSRAASYIAYAIIKYADDVLVYDIYSASCISVYLFCSKFFNIQTNELTISQIKQLFVCYLILVAYAKKIGFEWNTSTVIKCIKSNDKRINNGETNLNIFDVIIDYCKAKTTHDISTDNIRHIINLFETYFTGDVYSSSCDINPTQEWKLNKISLYEFLVALTLMKNNGFQLSYVN